MKMDPDANGDNDEDLDWESQWEKQVSQVAGDLNEPAAVALRVSNLMPADDDDLTVDSPDEDRDIPTIHDDDDEVVVEAGSGTVAKLSKFWECAIPEEIDVGNLFNNGQRFVIDGEGLVLELIHHPTLAYGQCLQFVYLLESYLNQFLSKNGKFEVVFFEDFESVWKTHKKGPFALLCRQITMKHLTNNLGITVQLFKNFWTTEWLSYLKCAASVFLLLSDETVCPCYESSQARCSFCQLYAGLQWTSIDVETDCVFMSPMLETTSQLFAYFLVAQEFAVDVKSRFDEYKKLWLEFSTRKKLSPQENSLFDSGFDVSNVATARLEFWASVCKVLPTEQLPQMELLHFILLHACLLPLVPLEVRSLQLNAVLPLESSLGDAINQLLTCAASCLPQISSAIPGGVLTDLFDYRLLVKLLEIAGRDPRGVDFSDLPIGDQLLRKMEEIDKHFGVANTVSDNKARVLCLNSDTFKQLKKQEQLPTNRATFNAAQSEPWIPIKIPELSHLFSGVHVDALYLKTDDPKLEKMLSEGRRFDETHQWHSGKQLSDDYTRTKESFTSIVPKDDRQKKRWLMNKQKYCRYMQFYGESLEGGDIQLTNIVVGSQQKAAKVPTKSETKKSGGKKADMLISQNLERLHLQRDIPADKATWKNCKKNLIVNNKESFSISMQAIDRFMKSAKTIDYQYKALKRKIQDGFKAWTTFDWDKDALVLILDSARVLHEQYLALIQKDIKGYKRICDILKEIGFTKGLRLFTGKAESGKGKNLVKPKEEISFDRFQLEFMGEHLSREESKTPDPRVEHFVPDEWQRKLLDAVDQRKSAIIVAPTSSGKTYISYYCIEQVLRESNDGVVVYVSPTKAIVNQAAATVYARFRGKVMPPGRAVYGVFTGDYRCDAMNCQVLLTVPECLRILMLSPHRQDWVKKIRYVIFDEVHCIGDGHDGKVWEQLLLLIRCPFLALSATIANPEDFLQWLNNAWSLKKKQQHNICNEIQLIVYNERYCDLRKFVTTFNENESSSVNAMQFSPLHPAAVTRGGMFPADVHLSPNEVVVLYDSIRRAESTAERPLMKDSELETYFEKDVFISKSRVREFEEKLKHAIQQMEEDGSTRSLQTVREFLGSEVLNPENESVCLWRRGATDVEVESTIVGLVDMLRERRMLPAILFMDSQKLVEEVASTILSHFLKKEEGRREDPEEKRRLAILMKQIDREKKQVKRIRDASDSTKSKGNSDKTEKNVPSAEPEDGAKFSARISTVPDPDCTLAVSGKLSEPDRKWIFENRLRNQYHSEDLGRFVRCLERGVGYHHAGLSNKLRSSVECLFRKGYLQFASATGTLALGVHMPCKTVVFFQDSQLLTPLQYRQRSGRAGRRGYDVCGNVVFCGLPKNKVRRLMTTEISRLQGQFPLSISDVLRFLLLLAKADDKTCARYQIEVLLQAPFISVTAKDVHQQVGFFFLFAVQILGFHGLIDLNGRPLELAGIATQLHHHDPYNFIFVYLLNKGLFHDLCGDCRGNNGVFRPEVVNQLLVVLSHLFGRSRVHSYAIEKFRELPSPNSKLILEPFPEPFLSAVETYTRKVKMMIAVYLHSVAKSSCVNASKERCVLPVSKMDFSNRTTSDADNQFGLLKEFKQSVVPNDCFPHFMSLSGLSDEKLMEILVNGKLSTSGSIYLDETLLPLMNPDLKLNSYIIDFYNHGSRRFLTRENFIRESQIYNLLHDFSLVLRSIAVSLGEMSTKTSTPAPTPMSTVEAEPVASTSNDPVYRTILYIADEFTAKFDKAFPYAGRKE